MGTPTWNHVFFLLFVFTYSKSKSKEKKKRRRNLKPNPAAGPSISLIPPSLQIVFSFTFKFFSSKHHSWLKPFATALSLDLFHPFFFLYTTRSLPTFLDPTNLQEPNLGFLHKLFDIDRNHELENLKFLTITWGVGSDP